MEDEDCYGGGCTFNSPLPDSPLQKFISMLFMTFFPLVIGAMLHWAAQEWFKRYFGPKKELCAGGRYSDVVMDMLFVLKINRTDYPNRYYTMLCYARTTNYAMRALYLLGGTVLT